MDASDAPKSGARIGRQPSTSQAELGRISLQLFIKNGFENTTVDAVAAAAGIGRRTLFRYFPSKNDLPWGDFDTGLDQMRAYLRTLPASTPLVEAVTSAIVEFNRFPAQEIPLHRERMKLLLNVPALAAHSTLRYAAWRQVVADYTALRMGAAPDSLGPQAIAAAFLGACLAAYGQWLEHEDADLLELLDQAFVVLKTVFATTDASAAG